MKSFWAVVSVLGCLQTFTDLPELTAYGLNLAANKPVVQNPPQPQPSSSNQMPQPAQQNQQNAQQNQQVVAAGNQQPQLSDFEKWLEGRESLMGVSTCTIIIKKFQTKFGATIFVIISHCLQQWNWHLCLSFCRRQVPDDDWFRVLLPAVSGAALQVPSRQPSRFTGTAQQHFPGQVSASFQNVINTTVFTSYSENKMHCYPWTGIHDICNVTLLPDLQSWRQCSITICERTIHSTRTFSRASSATLVWGQCARHLICCLWWLGSGTAARWIDFCFSFQMSIVNYFCLAKPTSGTWSGRRRRVFSRRSSGGRRSRGQSSTFSFLVGVCCCPSSTCSCRVEPPFNNSKMARENNHIQNHLAYFWFCFFFAPARWKGLYDGENGYKPAQEWFGDRLLTEADPWEWRQELPKLGN